jgi:hypothetical protein
MQRRLGHRPLAISHDKDYADISRIASCFAKEGNMATNAIIEPRAGRVKSRTVRFGSVTVTAPAPSRELVQQNIKRSTQALERVTQRLAKAGVILRPRKDVPLFSLDSDNPDVMIRKLNGKTERGAMIDGVFKATD